MKKKTIKKKKLSKECWSLDYQFIEWLNEHLKVYKKDASKFINLEFHKFEYQNREWTQREIIDRLIVLTDILVTDYDYLYPNEQEDKVNEMLDLWKIVFPAMWW